MLLDPLQSPGLGSANLHGASAKFSEVGPDQPRWRTGGLLESRNDVEPMLDFAERRRSRRCFLVSMELLRTCSRAQTAVHQPFKSKSLRSASRLCYLEFRSLEFREIDVESRKDQQDV